MFMGGREGFVGVENFIERLEYLSKVRILAKLSASEKVAGVRREGVSRAGVFIEGVFKEGEGLFLSFSGASCGSLSHFHRFLDSL